MSALATAPHTNDTAGARRIAEAFARAAADGRAALIPYVVAGYPDAEASFEVACATIDAGADLLEGQGDTEALGVAGAQPDALVDRRQPGVELLELAGQAGPGVGALGLGDHGGPGQRPAQRVHALEQDRGALLVVGEVLARAGVAEGVAHGRGPRHDRPPCREPSRGGRGRGRPP